jgi:DNA-binding NtrC family response regulator
VRELANAVERAVIAARGPVVESADLPAGALGSPESLLRAAAERRWTLRELEDAYIEETLRRCGGNRTLAAKRLGTSRKMLWQRRKKKPV